MTGFEPTEISDGTPVAWVTLGASFYLNGDLRSIWPQVLLATQALLRRPWAAGIKHIRRWDEPGWRPWDPRDVSFLLQDLEHRGPSRPSWRIELADQSTMPTLGFDWQDVSAVQGQYPRASWLRVRLPIGSTADELFQTTMELAAVLPAQQGRAGYQCHVVDDARRVGFDQAWAWARRYYGVEVVDPVAGSWDAVQGLLGVNWLTVVGKPWLEGKLKDVDLSAPAAPLRALSTPAGTVLVAGRRPTAGDQNLFEDVSAYTLASRLIEPALVAEPTDFPGMFTDKESTALWIRRFLDPGAWEEA